MQNPFEDLVPQQQNAQGQPAQSANPFEDLVPQQKNNVPRGTENAEDSRGFLNNFARHRLANVAGAAQNIAKEFLPNVFPEVGGVINALPGFSAGKKLDFYKDLGVEKGLPDELIQGGLEFAPFMYGGSGAVDAIKSIPKAAQMFSKFAQAAPKTSRFADNVAKNVVGSDAMAASNSNQDNLGENLGMSTALAAASVPAGYAIGAPLQYAAKKIAQSSIPGLTKKATDILKEIPNPLDYSQKMFQKFASKSETNSANWNNVDRLAGNIDNKLTKSVEKQTPTQLSILDESGNPLVVNKTTSSPQINFNAKPYHDYIDSFKQNIDKLEPAQQEQYKQAIGLADKAKELAPQSFSGMVSSSKNINSDLTNYLKLQGIDAPDRQSKGFLSGLKNTVRKDLLNANKDNIPKEDFDEFSNAWKTANQSHQDLQETFKSQQPGTGTVKPIRQTREMYEAAKQNGGNLDASIINKYMPRPTVQGTEGLDQLAKIMGSKEDAQNAAKSYLNRRPLNNGNTVLDSSTEYAKLSPDQREWIYGNSKEGNLLKAVNDTRTEFGKEPERSFYKMFSHPAASMFLGPVVGGAAGYYAGGEKGALAGTAIPMIASALARKGAGNLSPEMIQGMIRYAQSQPKNVGRNINAILQSQRYGGQE